MSCGSAMRAYSDAGPAWLLKREPTHAIPALRALAAAICAARLITRWPIALSPSISAVAARSSMTRMFGRRLMPPDLMRLM